MCVYVYMNLLYIYKGVILKVSRVTRHASRFPHPSACRILTPAFHLVRPSAYSLSAYVVDYTSNLHF